MNFQKTSEEAIEKNPGAYVDPAQVIDWSLVNKFDDILFLFSMMS